MTKMTNRANWRRRLLSALLAAIMVFTVIPAVSLSAFAESLGPVIVQLSGGHSQRHTVANYQTVNANARAQYGLSSVAAPMDGSNGNPDICVPGLSSTDNMVPQGLTYWPAKNWILISSYEPNDAKPSCVYAVSVSTGRLVAQFNLQTASGANVTEHVSGIACSANNLYIADAGSKMAYIPLSELDVAEGTVKTVRYADSVNLNLELNNANTSYASFGDGILWTGNFYIKDDDKYGTKANDSSGTMMLGYDLSGYPNSAAEWEALQGLAGNPSYCIPLDAYGVEKVQCATVKNGFCYVGTSYGRTNDSHMYIFNVNLGSTIGNITVNGRTKPAVLLTNKRDYSHLPMTEGLLVYGGYLWNIFESATYLYNGAGSLSKNPTDVLWRFDISTLLGIDREDDGAEAATGDDQFKAANVSFDDLTFVVPEVIYLTPTTNNSSSFQYYANNTAAGAVVAGYETTGKIYYSYSGASSATLSYKFYNENLSKELSDGSVTLSSSTISSGNTGVSITGGMSPSVSDGGSSYIQWELNYTDSNDGKTKKAYAYSFVYKPYFYPVFAATRTYNDRGVESDLQSMAWISGIHGVIGAGNASNGNDTGYRGINTGNFSPLSGTLTLPTQSNNGGGNSQDIDFYHYGSRTPLTGYFQNYSAGTGDGNVSSQAVSPKGYLAVDRSRYTNFNQIPNMKIGFLISYVNEGSASVSNRWYGHYLSDFSSTYSSSFISGTQTDKTFYTSNRGSYIVSDVAYEENNVPSREYCRPKLVNNSTWNKEVPQTNATVAIKGAARFGTTRKGSLFVSSDNSSANNSNIVVLDVNVVNKTDLRTAVQNATKQMARLGVNGAAHGKLTSCYFKSDSDYRWVAFQHAYKNAMMALTRLDGSNDQALITALNNALANLCTKVTFANSNTGRGTITTVSGKTNPAYVTIGTAQSVSINPSTYVTATAKTGYSFEGWSTSSTATSGSTGNVSVGYNNTLYAIWKPIEYTISYNLNGGTVSGNPTSYTIETTPVLLNNPTRTGYTFAGWTGANGTTPQMDVVVPNGVSSGLSQYTTSSPYTAGGRDHILGDTFAVQSGTTYRVFVTAKRVSGTLNMQGGIWYTSQTSGASYDGYGGAFSYFRDAGNGWAVYYKDVTVPAGKQAGRFYIQLEQNGTGGTSSWQIADCSVTKFSLGNISYTANWTPHAYTVHFNGNGETGGSTADQSFVYGTAQNLNANGFTRQYTVTYKNNNETADTTATATYTFNGWKGSQRLINDATERSYTNNSTTDYYDFPQWTIPGPFAANEVFVLEFDAKGSGVVTNYFYGASNYWQVATGVTGNGTVWTGTDGHVDQALTSTFQHYKITWTLKSSGNANVNKYVLFRALKGGNSITFKNVVFYKETGAATYTNRQSVNNLCTADGAVYEMRAQWTPGSVTLPTPTYANHAFEGWYTDAALTNKVSGTAFTPTANTTLYAKWILPAKNDVYVLDFGLGAKLDVLANDISGAALSAVPAGTADYSLTKEDSQISFIPLKAMSEPIVFDYTVTYKGSPYTATATVIPANNVYYEDSFFDFSDKSGAVWQKDGTTGSAVQAAVEAAQGSVDLYGSDAAYLTSTTYSLGSAMYAEVSPSAKTASKASFTFTGTGFDLYAVTNGTTGVTVVTIEKLVNGTPTTIARNLVNTYYGYNYGRLYLKDGKVSLDASGQPIYYAPAGKTDGTFFIRGTIRGQTVPSYYASEKEVVDGVNANTAAYAYGWVEGAPAPGSPAGIYQVPVISRMGLAYGVYRVTLEPRYAAAQDLTGNGKYRFYIDSVRVYDPLNPASLGAAATAAYQGDNEYGAQFVELRDQLITAPASSNLTGGSLTGIAFLENKETETGKTALQSYAEVGPKNEIYLAAGQAIAFTLTTSDGNKPAKLSLGMKLLTGGSGEVTVAGSKGSVPFTLNSVTDLYRDISGAVNWSATGSSTFTTGTITVTNSGSAAVSLTKLKWSYGAPEAAAQVAFAPKMLRFSVSQADLDFAGAAFDEINAQQTTASSEGVTVTWDHAEVEIGGTATLTITAPASFEKAFKDGNEIAGYTELPDGSRQWTVTVAVEEEGEYTCDITLEDENGYRTKAISAGSFTVVPPAEPETDPADNGEGNGTTRRWSFYDLLQAIINFFRRIVSFFKSGIA